MGDEPRKENPNAEGEVMGDTNTEEAKRLDQMKAELGRLERRQKVTRVAGATVGLVALALINPWWPVVAVGAYLVLKKPR